MKNVRALKQMVDPFLRFDTHLEFSNRSPLLVASVLPITQYENAKHVHLQKWPFQ